MKIRILIFAYIWVISAILNSMNSFVSAQENSSHKMQRYGGLFFGLGGCSQGIGCGAGLSIQIKHNVYTFRSVMMTEFTLFGDKPGEGFWDLGVLYGRGIKKKFVAISASMGVAVAGGTCRGAYIGPGGGLFSGDRYEKISFLTAGLPLQAQFLLTPLPFLGIGIFGFGNLNPKMSTAGALLFINVGKQW